MRIQCSASSAQMYTWPSYHLIGLNWNRNKENTMAPHAHSTIQLYPIHTYVQHDVSCGTYLYFRRTHIIQKSTPKSVRLLRACVHGEHSIVGKKHGGLDQLSIAAVVRLWEPCCPLRGEFEEPGSLLGRPGEIEAALGEGIRQRHGVRYEQGLIQVVYGRRSQRVRWVPAIYAYTLVAISFLCEWYETWGSSLWSVQLIGEHCMTYHRITSLCRL